MTVDNLYELDINFLVLFIFIYGFSEKVTFAFLADKKQCRNYQRKHFCKKNLLHFFSNRFQSIAIFTWRVTYAEQCNYLSELQ